MSSGTKTTLRFILKPLDTIFFGDEKSFFRQEYLQRSRMLPQQSGVLGFLRYEALRRAALLGRDHHKWSGLIGEKSFNGSNTEFGVISNISPVSIYTGKVDLFPLRNPVGFTAKPIDGVKVDFCDGFSVWDSLHLFEGSTTGKRYDPKDHSEFGLIFSDFNGNNYDAECEKEAGFKKEHGYKRPNWNNMGIFWKDIRPGITKSYGGVPNDEGFFKTEFLRMNPDFAYSFAAEIKDHADLPVSKWKDSAIVRFGGDRSLYKMTVVDSNHPQPATSGNVFVLKSDALVGNDIYNHCNSAISDTHHFRNVRTKSEAEQRNWNIRPTEWGGSAKGIASSANVLLKHGSILIAKDDTAATKLAEALESNAAYRNIGYNHYQRLNQLPKGKTKSA